MKKIKILLLLISMVPALCFAGKYSGKCGAYQEAFAAQMVQQTMQGSPLGRSAMYPLLILCLFDQTDPEDFSNGEERYATKKGVALWHKIVQANEKVVKEYIESGEFSAPKVQKCLLNDEMRENMGTSIWNKVKQNFYQQGIKRYVFKFIFLDKETCKEWNSREVTEDDL